MTIRGGGAAWKNPSHKPTNPLPLPGSKDTDDVYSNEACLFKTFLLYSSNHAALPLSRVALHVLLHATPHLCILSQSRCGMLVARTNCARCGATTSRTPMVSFLWWIPTTRSVLGKPGTAARSLCSVAVFQIVALPPQQSGEVVAGGFFSMRSVAQCSHDSLLRVHGRQKMC